MNLKLKLLKDLLLQFVAMIDNGTCNPSDKELDEIIKVANQFNKGVKRISKAYACDNVLHCSHSTFDNYLKLGIIPPGHKEKGFKELSWALQDFDKALQYSNKVKA